ncbi:hypothetical protein DPMN_001864 [Dreissena polymorpha]|uniref:Uncharacterized protein n=1 Tax=Dreissena polymorpha TaxID=45954 RepID=A0A9D4MIK9_DREPO|nr:hypothetical protein DPMN_001864 [Dreissena polymorpha]
MKRVQNVDGLEEIDVGSLMDSSSLSYRRKVGSTKSGKNWPTDGQLQVQRDRYF